MHGIGGQGVVVAAEMLAEAFVEEGKYVGAFCVIGAQRRGGNVSGFVRFDDKPIKEKTRVYYPDCLIITNPIQLALPTIFAGLKPESILVLNTTKVPEKPLHPNVKLAGVIDATGIALQELGITVVNSTILGTFAGTTQWISMDSVVSVLKKRFSGQALDKNITCAERGFHGVKLLKW